MSGLVRGNRRKAVFAFRGCLPKGVWRVSRFRVLGFTTFFRKCGEKSEIAEHNPIFGNKTAGRGNAKPGSGRPISVLPRTSGIAARKYAVNS